MLLKLVVQLESGQRKRSIQCHLSVTPMDRPREFAFAPPRNHAHVLLLHICATHRSPARICFCHGGWRSWACVMFSAKFLAFRVAPFMDFHGAILSRGQCFLQSWTSCFEAQGYRPGLGWTPWSCLKLQELRLQGWWTDKKCSWILVVDLWNYLL